MTSSWSYSATESFTLSHAKKIASKVATDLHRFQRFYGSPSNASIAAYEGELIELLKNDVLGVVTYGFKRNGLWTLATVRYKSIAGELACDDDPGKIVARVDVNGAAFSSFLEYNARWFGLTSQQQAAIKNQLPFERTNGTSPTLERGSWADDLTYAAGGRGLSRSTVRQ